MKTLHAHLDYVTAVHFNRDATLIVSCALDGLMYVSCSPAYCLFHSSLLVESGTLLMDNVWKHSQRAMMPSGMSWSLHTFLFYIAGMLVSQQVQFSPNSKYILSTAHDSAIRLWDYQTTRCLKTYVGHVNNKYCISACFSVTGGKWIVAGSEDHKVYIWDLQTREIMQVLEGHRGELESNHCVFMLWCRYFQMWSSP